MIGHVTYSGRRRGDRAVTRPALARWAAPVPPAGHGPLPGWPSARWAGITWSQWFCVAWAYRPAPSPAGGREVPGRAGRV